MTVRILIGDALARLRELPDESVHCCVTSPPYWGLRDYGVDGQIGLEPTPGSCVDKLVLVFAEVRRVLRPDGTLWLNLGDSYTSGNRVEHGSRIGEKQATNRGANLTTAAPRPMQPAGLKPKDLVGIPWTVAFALRSDGWYLRSDIIWHKPNPMPESVTDRPTKSHEYVFLLAKSERYFYDADAIREPDAGTDHARTVLDGPSLEPSGGLKSRHKGIRTTEGRNGQGRNIRTVWPITTRPFPGSHFATMPPALAERCILAGCPVGGTVLDPFGGAGTTGLVADRLQRDAVLIELNPAYAEMARERIKGAAPMFADVELERGAA